MPAVTVVRGELKNSFVQSHPVLARLDKSLAWALMLLFIALEASTFGFSIFSFLAFPCALGLFTVSGCLCSFVIALLTFMLWHTFCYYDPRMRKMMTTPTRFTPDGFMRVGFLPIPAAASVGLLLFVTAVFVSPSIQGGTFLQPSTAGGLLAWLPTMTCRAASIESADYLTSWTARMDRSAPSTHLPIRDRLQYLFGSRPSTKPSEGSCFKAPYLFTQDDVMDTKTGKDVGISNLANPEGDTEGRLCMYHCVTWQSINLQTLLTSSGTISVGAGIVVVLTEYFSGKLGLPTITENTSPEELEGLINRIGPNSVTRVIMKPFQASMISCALPILAIGFYLKYFLVIKIDADGQSTVDFYVTYCLVYSSIIVTLMRMWHFFECRPQLYTKNMWHSGLDKFIVPNSRLEKWQKMYGEGEFVKTKDIGDHLCLVNIDLYQWMHLRAAERTELLVNYCRRPGQGGTEANSKLQVLAPCKVAVTHEVEFGTAGKCTCEKLEMLPAQQELIVVSWKNEQLVRVKVLIAGKMEIVLMDKEECLEKSPAWDKDIFDTLDDDIDGPDAPDAETGIPASKVNATHPTASALQQRLLAIDQKMDILETKSTLMMC